MASSRQRKRRVVRLIPVTVTMLSLLLIIKVNQLYIGSRQLREFYAVHDAVAEEKKEEAKQGEGHKEEAKKEEGHGEKQEAKADTAVKEGEIKEGDAKKEGEHDEAKKEEGHGDAKEEGGHGEEGDGHGGGAKKEEEPRTFGTGKSTVKEIEALKARNSQPQFSKSEIDLLQNLSKRRDELEQREKDLELKSKVLEATEKRISDKMTEMKTLEADLSKIVAQYNEKQDAQIKSLVKIYENMKPDEAAKIFDELEMPILLEVIDTMSERKVAPVLANMSPKKARDVTQELAEMRKRAAMNAALAGAKPAGR